MIFQDKILELNQADRTISWYLPNAFYSNLMRRYSLEEEATRSTPTQKLDKRPPRFHRAILDGERSKLYQETVGELLWSSNLRPDTSFAVNQLSQSYMNPTEQDEEQLRSLLQYMHATQHLCVSLGVPRNGRKQSILNCLLSRHLGQKVVGQQLALACLLWECTLQLPCTHKQQQKQQQSLAQ